MDVELNVTYITLDGYVEMHKYRYVYFVIMFTAYVLIICSNCTVVCLICIHKNLHEPMYIFIAALLINSVLFSTTIYPKLLVDFLSDKQVISYSACLFQGLIHYIFAYSEFLLLAAMSYDRYVSICKPLQYAAIMKKTTTSVLLVSAWLLPVCEIAVAVSFSVNVKLCGFTLKGIFCNNSLFSLYCVRIETLSVYGVVILLNMALLPVLFILFAYTRILIISYGSCREVRRKAAHTCIPHLMVLLNFSCLITYDVIVVRLESGIPKSARLIMTLQVVLYHPLLNPIIYGLKMKEISKHFRRLFCVLTLLSH
ncbi:olfactory receptor 4C12-like [Chaetodon trifascialis]|uniref:olfactory receptor 4C12-like n=1 Tax=Chaetodon trifascialis TaxID=109706 RepID=UPI003991C77B